MDSPNMQNLAEGPQANNLPTFAVMATARRWLLWRSVPQPEKKPLKVPYYLNGRQRGTTDTDTDLASLARYHEAKDVLAAKGGDWGLAFALGPDGSGGHWQGIDFDDVKENRLADLANTVAGYVEMSPSGNGAHAIGYGRSFASLGSNASGIEAYAAGRFFTVTEDLIRDGEVVCLAAHVEQQLAPRHGTARAAASTASAIEIVQVDAKTVTELRSALNHMRSVDYHLWVKIGIALSELGGVRRGLWLDWSSHYERFDAKEANRNWATFSPDRTGWQSVFAEAQRQGWTNPASREAQVEMMPNTAELSGERRLTGRSLAGVTMRAIEWLWLGWIPKGYITIFAGETGAGKSTVLADIAARVTTGAPWPGPIGIPGDRREPGRVLWLGSEDGIEEMTVPRLTACGADLNNVIEIQGAVQQGKRNTFSMQDDIEAVSQWLAQARAEGKPFAMLVIDPVTSYLPGQKLRKVDMNDAGQLRTILEPWLILAQQHNIAIVCVTHFGKDTSRSMLHRVLGSAAFGQTCRSLIAVMDRTATDDYEPDPNEKLMMQVKVNLPDRPDGAWKFCTERVQAGVDQRNSKPIYATRPAWDEQDSGLTPNTVVGRQRGPKSRQEGPFVVWLRGKFANHPPGTWLQVNDVKWSAVKDRAASENWWAKHSSEHLEKENRNGDYYCRPKATD